MKTKLFFAAYVCLLLSSFGRADEPRKWQDKMKELAQVMGDLLPELAATKGDDKQIEKSAKRLSELVHTLSDDGGMGRFSPPPDADPSIGYFAALFERETKRAYWAIQSGYGDYGKNILRSVTSNCIACHTRHDKGPEFPTFPLNPKVKNLSAFEKAQLFAATRQFDTALSQYEALLQDEAFAKASPFDWQHAARQALTLSVRVKKDPAATERIIDTVLKSPTTPAFMAAYFKKLKETTQAWSKEPVRTLHTQKQVATEMRRLLAAARKVQQYPADRSADILYLRTSAAAHEVLGMHPNEELAAEALFVAGTSYETLNFNSTSPLHEMYYEACVRREPHTPIARECFLRYEESVNFGFTGSGGTSVPYEIEKVVRELDTLSKVGVK